MQLMFAIMSDPPFSQWGDVAGGDLFYLLPWVAIIWLIIPKGGGGKASKPARASSGSGGGGGLGLGTYAVIAVVAYVVLGGVVG